MLVKRISISFAALFLMLMLSLSLAGQATAEGSTPTAENLELKTQRNLPIEGLLSARDAEEDVVSFEITTKPVKGDIQLKEEGHFVYIPRQNKKGRDYFGYRAIDAEGNVSQEATVLIRIEK